MKHHLFALGFRSFALLCCLLPLRAYGYQTNTSGGKILRWADSSLPLAWYMNMAGYTGVSAADAESAFKHGMQQWSAPSCTKFRTVYKGTTNRGNSSDKHNVLMFGPLFAGSSTTAITYTRWGSQSKNYTDADIVFRSSKPWSINPNSNQLDLRGTATHEIGHLLGLSHSGVTSATMYAKTATGPSPRRFLDTDDIQGLCFLYPAGTASSDGKRGSLCGGSASGVDCEQGLLCVSKSGIGSYCVEPCQSGTCPNGGKCLSTTAGTQFCACDSNSDCNAGQLCQGRNCFADPSACQSDQDCGAEQLCQQSRCVAKPPPPECTSDTDCPQDHTCKDGKCLANTGQRGALCGGSAGGARCNQGLLCVNKSGQPAYCVELCQDGSCPNGGKCLSTTAGSRFCACDSNSDCPSGQTCINRNCFAQDTRCQSDQDCTSPKSCVRGQCQAPAAECAKDADCPSGKRCQEGACVDPPPECQGDNDCAVGQNCQEGACVDASPRGFGEACREAKECSSQLCAAITSNPSTLYCTKPCSPDKNECPPGYRCGPLGTQGNLCLLATASEPSEAVTSDGGGLPDGGSLQESGGGEVEVTPEGQGAEPGMESNGRESGKSGCGCQSGAGDWQVSLLFFLLLFGGWQTMRKEEIA